ncbi:MAG: hypothetical protein KKE05_05405 [Nanoarchaeota archaeon]|nr:hypothetical protein [Nanoarchaeota archaeon]
MQKIDACIIEGLNKSADSLNSLLRFGRVSAQDINLMTYGVFVPPGKTVDDVLDDGRVRVEAESAMTIFGGVMARACESYFSVLEELNNGIIAHALEEEIKKRGLSDPDGLILPGVKNFTGAKEGKAYLIDLYGSDTLEEMLHDLVLDFKINPDSLCDYLNRWQFYDSLPVDQEGRWVQNAKRKNFYPLAKQD